MDAALGAPALDVRGMSKSYAGVTVLSEADLVVRPGTVHALVGHNGSGKSTFIKALAGFHPVDTPVTGRCFDQEFAVGDHESANAVGLRFVHQDLGLVDTMSVADNLALGVGYPRHMGALISESVAVKRARQAMVALGYDLDVRAAVGQLTASERTGVAIARALEEWTGTPSVVVLDEPTASMPAPEVRRLFEAIKLLRKRGLGIVYVSHHIDEILEIADDLTVLRSGRVALSRSVRGLTHEALVEAIVGRQVVALKPAAAERAPATATPVLEVDSLSTNTIQEASFHVLPGEVVGLAGLVGSGRHEVLAAIGGLTPRGGAVSIGGRKVRADKPKEAIAAGLGFVPANRRTAAVLPGFDIGRNLTVSGVQEFTRLGLLGGRKELHHVAEWMTRLEVSPNRPTTPILTLSGGNQQKVMVGRWLRRNPVVLALDEPTQGVDVGAKQSIYEAVRTTARDGNGVLIASSDADELATVCHRVLVFARGRVIAELTTDELSAENIDAISLGTGVTA